MPSCPTRPSIDQSTLPQPVGGEIDAPDVAKLLPMLILHRSTGYCLFSSPTFGLPTIFACLRLWGCLLLVAVQRPSGRAAAFRWISSMPTITPVQHCVPLSSPSSAVSSSGRGGKRQGAPPPASFGDAAKRAQSHGGHPANDSIRASGGLSSPISSATHGRCLFFCSSLPCYAPAKAQVDPISICIWSLLCLPIKSSDRSTIIFVEIISFSSFKAPFFSCFAVARLLFPISMLPRLLNVVLFEKLFI
uniref:Uncharacterized protein n=1 Tax=Oryza glumipatula TaxID=40148 RepID=A0A0E0B5Q9_9ORYZ